MSDDQQLEEHRLHPSEIDVLVSALHSMIRQLLASEDVTPAAVTTQISAVAYKLPRLIEENRLHELDYAEAYLVTVAVMSSVRQMINDVMRGGDEYSGSSVRDMIMTTVTLENNFRALHYEAVTSHQTEESR